MVSGRYFVDKSKLFKELLPALCTEKRFYCITRLRRFVKTIMANMVGTLLGKAADAEETFKNLEISRCKQYQSYLNKYNVIYIDLSEAPRDCSTYHQYISRFRTESIRIWL